MTNLSRSKSSVNNTRGLITIGLAKSLSGHYHSKTSRSRERLDRSNMSHVDEIISLLQRRPGLTAQIAQEVGTDRRSINSVLYGQLRGKVIQDNSYRWRIAEPLGSESRSTASTFQASETPLARLCRYYLDCLSFDQDNGVSLFAASKFALDYFHDPGLPSLEGTLANGLNVDGIQPLLRRLSRDRNRKTLVLGYPIRLRFQRARTGTGWSGYLVEPVMLFALRGNLQDLANSTFDPLPTVNFTH